MIFINKLTHESLCGIFYPVKMTEKNDKEAANIIECEYVLVLKRKCRKTSETCLLLITKHIITYSENMILIVRMLCMYYNNK